MIPLGYLAAFQNQIALICVFAFHDQHTFTLLVFVHISNNGSWWEKCIPTKGCLSHVLYDIILVKNRYHNVFNAHSPSIPIPPPPPPTCHPGPSLPDLTSQLSFSSWTESTPQHSYKAGPTQDQYSPSPSLSLTFSWKKLSDLLKWFHKDSLLLSR